MQIISSKHGKVGTDQKKFANKYNAYFSTTAEKLHTKVEFIIVTILQKTRQMVMLVVSL